MVTDKSYTKSTGIWEFRYEGSQNFTTVDPQNLKEIFEIHDHKFVIKNISNPKTIELRLRIDIDTKTYTSENIKIFVEENGETIIFFKE